METYIFDFTNTGADVGEALVRAAQRGLDVRLVVDGAGTPDVPVDWRQRWDAAGVQWRVFSPLGRLGFLIPSRWRRLHRKLVVVDAGLGTQLAFCGGINVLDDYFDPNHGALAAPRFDFAVRLRGPVVQQVTQALTDVWQRLDLAHQIARGQWRGAATAAQRSMQLRVRGAGAWLGLPDMRRGLTDNAAFKIASTIPQHGSVHLARAGIVTRDNLRNRRRIERAYLQAVGHAQRDVTIANAYFLPGRKMRVALIAAAKRGVRVRLLLQGRYEYFMQYHAARPVYAALLAANVEIYEYSASFLHAKVAVVDADMGHAWATVGSSNLDPLSLLLAREANVVVLDCAFALALRDKLEAAMASDGTRLDPNAYAHRPWSQRLRDRIAFAIMRGALWATGKRY
jgi:cardiolipin synthase A/B